MAYIKSKSNYVLKTKHQITNGGTVYERDMSTVRAKNGFNNGQTPIYRSGNFLISINNTNNTKKNTLSKNWTENTSGNVWNSAILQNYQTDDKSSYDKEILIKNNYYDLRDFAYFGSCSELIRASINNILSTFPGELFAPFSARTNHSNEFITEGIVDYYKVSLPSNKGGNVVIRFGQRIDRDTSGNYIFETDEYGNTVPKIVGNDNVFLLDNPFNIDIHSQFKDISITESDPLKYFTNNGFNNYQAINENGEKFNISWKGLPLASVYVSGNTNISEDIPLYITYVVGETSTIEHKAILYPGQTLENGTIVGVDYSICVGDKLGVVEIYVTDEDGDVIDVLKYIVYVGENGKYVYGIDANEKSERKKYIFNVVLNDGEVSVRGELRNASVESYISAATLDTNAAFLYSIRPKEEWINLFYRNLDEFERLLVNRKTTPAYTAYFKVTRENEKGYYYSIESFTFPTTYGGYNLGGSGYKFESYLNSLIDVATFYDERFSDNLYRSLTHEAIKNFDWSYYKDANNLEKDSIKESADKISNILHVFGRGFDNLKLYADSIKNINNISYDDISNMPDYFFSDSLDTAGWDIHSILPLSMKEYDDEGNEIDIDADSGDCQTRKDLSCRRVFSVISGRTITPYNNKDSKFPEGYFVGCKSESGTCEMSEFDTVNGEKINGDVYFDCSGVMRRRIKNYMSEITYTMPDVNNEFVKRLLLNSPYIWRHKGTLHGIDMVMSMFGMKSKKWAEKKGILNQSESDGSKSYDYEVKEYTSFTTRIKDEWSDRLNSFKYEWLNNTKNINYDTEEFRNGINVPYQGLPVAYREYDSNTRYLYPLFEKNEIYDGNPYYQMNGGWLSKYPFDFDNDNNLIINKGDEYPIFTETVRNIKSCSNIDELLNNSSLAEKDGTICHVDDISGKFAIVDGSVYNIYEEIDVNDKEKVHYYFKVVPNDGYLSVGNAYFNDFVDISNPYAEDGTIRYYLSNGEYDEKELKVYLVPKEDNNDIYDYTVIIRSDNNSVGTFNVFINGQSVKGEKYTHYFKLNNSYANNQINDLGWVQLKETDYDYLLINNIINYGNGNNPHDGHMNYDNGHEYFTYLDKLFKYPSENNLFNYPALSYYDEDGSDYKTDIENFGFKGLINDDHCRLYYDDKIYEDNKIHYFGDYFSQEDGRDVKYTINDVCGDNEYNLSSIERVNGDSGSTYGNDRYDETIDGVTNQIVNNKRISIIFYLKSNCYYSKEAIEEIKYIDSVILPYLTQVIPSGAIVDIKYKYNGQNTKYYTIISENRDIDDNSPVEFYINGEWVVVGYIEDGKCVIELDEKDSMLSDSFNFRIRNDYSGSSFGISEQFGYSDYLGVQNKEVTATSISSSTFHTYSLEGDNGYGKVVVSDSYGENPTIVSAITETSENDVSAQVMDEYSDWLFVSRKEDENNVFIIKASENTTNSTRVGYIKFTSNEETKVYKFIEGSDNRVAVYTVYTVNIPDGTEVAIYFDSEKTEGVNSIVKNGAISYVTRYNSAPENIYVEFPYITNEGDVFDILLPNSYSEAYTLLPSEGGSGLSISGITGVKYSENYTYHELDGDEALIDNTISVGIGETKYVEMIHNVVDESVELFIDEVGDVDWLSEFSTEGSSDSSNLTFTALRNENTYQRTHDIKYYIKDGNGNEVKSIFYTLAQMQNNYAFEFTDFNELDNVDSIYGDNTVKYFSVKSEIGDDDHFTITIPSENVISRDSENNEVDYSVRVNSQWLSAKVENNQIKINVSRNVVIGTRKTNVVLIQDVSGKQLVIEIKQEKVTPSISNIYAIGDNGQKYFGNSLEEILEYDSSATVQGILVIPMNAIEDGSMARIMSLDETDPKIFANVENTWGGNYSLKECGIEDMRRFVRYTSESDNLIYNGYNTSEEGSWLTSDSGYTNFIPYTLSDSGISENLLNVYSRSVGDKSVLPMNIEGTKINPHFIETREETEGKIHNVFTDMNGMSQTLNLYAYDKDLYKKFYAISDVYDNYKTDKISENNWYLPAMGEWMCVLQNIVKINNALGKLYGSVQNVKKLYGTGRNESDKIYWVSSIKSSNSGGRIGEHPWATTLGGRIYGANDIRKMGVCRRFTQIIY